MKTGTANKGEPVPSPLLIAVTGKGAGQKELGASGTCEVADERVRERRSGLCVPIAFCEPRHCSVEVCGWRGKAGSGAWVLGLLFVLR